MKAIYNNSQNSLIAFKGDHEPIQFYKGGQLIDNLSAVPLSIEGNPAQYKSEYKKNLLSLGLEGNTFQQTYEGYNLLSFLGERELKDIQYATQGATQFDTNYYYTGSSPNGYLNRAQNKGFSLLEKGFQYISGNTAYGVSFPMKAKPNTTYYAKGYGENVGIRIGQFDENWQYLTNIDTVREEQTFTTRETTSNLLITFLPLDSSNLTFSVFEAMVSTSPITEYEPYVGGIPSPNPQYPQEIVNAENLSVQLSGEPYIEPQTVEIPKSATFNEGTKEILLAKLGDVYDDLTIDRLTNKVVHNKRINRVVFDGTEAFIGTYNNFYVDVPLFIADYSQSLCSHFIRGEYSYPSTPYFQAFVGTVYFNNTGFDTLEDFISWVQTQYANGTPLTVEYVLYEPEQYTTNGIGAEFYNIVNLPTQNQTNIITVKGDIDPSKVAVTYAKWGGLNAN